MIMITDSMVFFLMASLTMYLVSGMTSVLVSFSYRPILALKCFFMYPVSLKEIIITNYSYIYLHVNPFCDAMKAGLPPRLGSAPASIPSWGQGAVK